MTRTREERIEVNFQHCLDQVDFLISGAAQVHADLKELAPAYSMWRDDPDDVELRDQVDAMWNNATGAFSALKKIGFRIALTIQAAGIDDSVLTRALVEWPLADPREVIAAAKMLRRELVVRVSEIRDYLPLPVRVCPVKLSGPKDTPMVLGRPQAPLRFSHYRLVKLLVEVWPRGVSKTDAEQVCGSPHKALDQLRSTSKDWYYAIYLPGKRGRGGYRLAAMDQETNFPTFEP